jgi:hypothetical protein
MEITQHCPQTAAVRSSQRSVISTSARVRLYKVFSVKSEMELNSKPVHFGQLTEQHFQMLLWLLDHCESVIGIQPYPSSFDQQKTLGLTFDSQVSLVRELVYIDLISTQVVEGLLNYAFTESFRSNFLSQMDIFKEELAKGNRLKPLLRF